MRIKNDWPRRSGRFSENGKAENAAGQGDTDILNRRPNERPGRRGRCFLWAAVLVCAALLTGGCSALQTAAIQTGFAESPYYHLGDTTWEHGGIEEYYFNQIPSSLNEIYRELYERIRDGETEADLYATVSAEDFWTAYYSVMADHPEFFWVGSNIEVQQNAVSGKIVHFKLTETVEASERESMRLQLEEAADAIIAGIPEGYSEYGQIKYVYEYLINTVDYDSTARDNQNVQSALLYHASVCAGYSRAFQYVLHRMGMFCTYVTGTTASGSDHAWNIVRLDGNYYNVDVTWGDPVFAGSMEGSAASHVMNYTYLCCTDVDLAATHVTDSQVAMPACTDDSYNYYKLNGMYYESFDYNTIYNALMDSVWNGRSSVTMKFGSSEAYETAQTELFQNGLIQDAAQYLMDQNGVSTWNYTYTADDDFYLLTIYWQNG